MKSNILHPKNVSLLSIFIPVKHKIRYGDLEIMFSGGEEKHAEICRGRILMHEGKQEDSPLILQNHTDLYGSEYWENGRVIINPREKSRRVQERILEKDLKEGGLRNVTEPQKRKIEFQEVTGTQHAQILWISEMVVKSRSLDLVGCWATMTLGSNFTDIQAQAAAS